jgi:hypothetical protein
MSDEHSDERDIETIVPAQGGTDPGTQDGVGEPALSGPGSDGVQSLEGEFGDLVEALDSDAATPEGATEASDPQG